MQLQGKTVIVTGAALGFGYGIARALGQEGARVVVTDVHEENLSRSISTMKSDGSEVIMRKLDASNLDAFKGIVKETIDMWGRLDAVVHAGVIMPLEDWERGNERQWWQEMSISFGGLLNATASAWDVMKNQGGGHIISIASGSSFRGYKKEVMYTAGKHANEGFVKALALEAAPYNIALNTVGPGKRIKPTALTWEEILETPESVRSTWTDPTELGKAFVWLISQPTQRFSGLRFDAGPILDSIRAEGWDFKFSPDKVTMYQHEMRYHMNWSENYSETEG